MGVPDEKYGEEIAALMVLKTRAATGDVTDEDDRRCEQEL